MSTQDSKKAGKFELLEEMGLDIIKQTFSKSRLLGEGLLVSGCCPDIYWSTEEDYLQPPVPVQISSLVMLPPQVW